MGRTKKNWTDAERRMAREQYEDEGRRILESMPKDALKGSPSGRMFGSQPNLQNLRPTAPGTPERARADELREAVRKHFVEPRACFCTGPLPGHDLCPCMERARNEERAQMREEILAEERAKRTRRK